jgi:transcriptional regulator with XRE-family HTH domain
LLLLLDWTPDYGRQRGVTTATEPTQFGAWLQNRMTLQQRSYRRVAMRAGVTHTTLYRIVQGADPSLGTAKRVAGALGYDLRLTDRRELVGRPRPEPPQAEA